MIGSLCSGIGAFELGLTRAGLGPVSWQCELDSYCRSVLARHWPEAKRFDDITTVDPASMAPVDLICAGFPCQPVSLAGRRSGAADHRWLWPHVARIIGALRPRFVAIENVPGLRTLGLREVLADLARLGFDAEWACFRASDLGAPHERNRLWLIATDADRVQLRDEPGWFSRAIGAAISAFHGRNSAPVDASNTDVLPLESNDVRKRQPETRQVLTDSDSARRLEQAISVAEQRGWSEYCGWHFDPTARVDDGPPRGMVERQRKALGNSIVVACAEVIGQVIRELMEASE